MCGIVGWIDFRRDLTLERERFAAAVAGLGHRGPDDSGTWVTPRAALGHRRLAVIDPAGGRQPMTASRTAGRPPAVLTFSGEIYNHRELRTELSARGHRFTSRSDTEVLLRAYLEWGGSMVERLAGMFAFGLWDAERQTLLLARDRLGVKPLYYHAYSDGLIFGSEPKAVMAHPGFRARMPESALPMLFNPRFTPAGTTVLLGLNEVRPGHVLEFGHAGSVQRRYWRLESTEHTAGFDETVEHVRSLLGQVTSEYLDADVPLASLLSGGLDSSAITALAAAQRGKCGAGPLMTFSVDFAGSERDFVPTVLRPERDSPYARQAARHIGTDHHEVLLDARGLSDAADTVRRVRDLPSLGQFDTSMYHLFVEVRRHVTVALSGEGADEVFGGYPWFHDPAMVRRDSFPWLGDGFQLTDCLAPDVKARIRPDEMVKDLYATLLGEVSRLPGESAVDARMREVLFLSLQGPLALLLDRKDRMSMAVGLEVRVPFCDHRLVEYVWNVPWSLKSAFGREKSLLRAAVADLLPEPVLNRPKSAYPASFDPDYAAAVRTRALALTADRDSPLAPLLDPERVRRLVERGGSSMVHANAAHVLIPLVEVDMWMRTYGIEVV